MYDNNLDSKLKEKDEGSPKNRKFRFRPELNAKPSGGSWRSQGLSPIIRCLVIRLIYTSISRWQRGKVRSLWEAATCCGIQSQVGGRAPAFHLPGGFLYVTILIHNANRKWKAWITWHHKDICPAWRLRKLHLLKGNCSEKRDLIFNLPRYSKLIREAGVLFSTQGISIVVGVKKQGGCEHNGEFKNLVGSSVIYSI